MMSPITAAVLFACWLLGIGLLAVYFETESVYCGVRVQQFQERESELIDELRRWEMRYNVLMSPDVLDGDLPDEFREFEYPDPEAPRRMVTLGSPPAG